MMQRSTMLTVLTFVCCLMMATSAQGRPFMPGDAKVEVISVRQLGAGDDFPGMWEYVYDVIGTVDAGGLNHTWGRDVWLTGFDSSLMVNRWTTAGELWNGTGNAWDYVPQQNWTASSTGLLRSYQWGTFPERWPSMWEDVEVSPGVFEKDWVLPTDPSFPSTNWAYDNEWHDGDDYLHGDSFFYGSATGYTYLGDLIDPDGVPASGDEYQETLFDPDGISFENTNGVISSFYGLAGLLTTFRVVHPYAPGNIEWHTYHNDGDTVSGITVGPVVPEPVTMSLLAIGGLAVLRRRRK